MPVSASWATILPDEELRGLLSRETASAHTLAERRFDINRRMGTLHGYAGALAMV